MRQSKALQVRLEKRVRDLEASLGVALVGTTGLAGVDGVSEDATWDVVSYHSVATVSNTATVIAEWPVDIDTLENVFVTLVGAEDVATIDVYGAGRACVMRRTGTGVATLSGAASLWASTTLGLASDFAVSGDNAQVRVTGNVGVAAHWKCVVRRLKL